MLLIKILSSLFIISLVIIIYSLNDKTETYEIDENLYEQIQDLENEYDNLIKTNYNENIKNELYKNSKNNFVKKINKEFENYYNKKIKDNDKYHDLSINFANEHHIKFINENDNIFRVLNIGKIGNIIIHTNFSIKNLYLIVKSNNGIYTTILNDNFWNVKENFIEINLNNNNLIENLQNYATSLYIKLE